MTTDTLANLRAEREALAARATPSAHPRCPCALATQAARAAGSLIRQPLSLKATGAARPFEAPTTIVLSSLNWPGVFVASGIFSTGEA